MACPLPLSPVPHGLPLALVTCPQNQRGQDTSPDRDPLFFAYGYNYHFFDDVSAAGLRQKSMLPSPLPLFPARQYNEYTDKLNNVTYPNSYFHSAQTPIPLYGYIIISSAVWCVGLEFKMSIQQTFTPLAPDTCCSSCTRQRLQPPEASPPP